MPKCYQCGKEMNSFRHHYVHRQKKMVEICDDCIRGIEAESKSSHVKIFEPFWHPNLDSKPVFIKSKKHLKEESDKRNMTSYY